MQIPFRLRVALANALVLALGIAAIAWLSLLSLKSGINATVDRMMSARVQRLLRGEILPSEMADFRLRMLLRDAEEAGDLPPLAFARLRMMREGSPAGGVSLGAAADGGFRISLTNRAGASLLGEDLPPWDANAVGRALDGKPVFSNVFENGTHLRVYTAPRYRGDELIGTVQAARSLTAFETVYREHTHRILALIPILVGVALVLGMLLANRALDPVRRVSRTAAEIGAGDLSRRLPVQGTDELAELASTFNGMIARLDAAFEQQRQFTADASHELRSPLARMKLTLSEALSQGTTVEELQEALRIADAAADRLGSLADDLLILTRSDTGQLPLRIRRMDLSALIRDAVALWEGAGPQIELELPSGPLYIEADPAHLHRVLDNLLQNAVRHTPPVGTVTVSAQASPGAIVLTIRDTGEGIPDGCLARVCERFYRVETARSPGAAAMQLPRGGSGLGLAIVRSLVEAHGGTLELASEVGRGTTAMIALPVRHPNTLTIS